MKSRTLVLRRETLTELSGDDLASVAGGNSGSCVTYTRIPSGCTCTGIYPSLNEPCTQTITDTIYSGTCTCL